MTVKWQERVPKCGKCEVRSSQLASPARLHPTRTHGRLTGQSTSQQVPTSTYMKIIIMIILSMVKYFDVDNVSAPFLSAFVIHAPIFSHFLCFLRYVSIKSSHTSRINIIQCSSSNIPCKKSQLFRGYMLEITNK